MDFEMKVTKKVTVKYLKVEAGVRYWEDAEINGQSDDDGTLTPMRVGDNWCPLIEIDSGLIVDWPDNKTADIHFKVCDAGVYTLLDADKNEIKKIAGYVPSMMSPGGSPDGDYIVMTISESGKIANWRADLSPFADD